MSKKDLWIVGQIRFFAYEEKPFWEFQGVFDDQALAEAACKTEQYFVGPAVLNEEVPEQPTIWPGAYYPAPREGFWYWVSEDEEKWFPAKRDSHKAGGWTNEDTWQDFDGEIKHWKFLGYYG